MDEMPDHSCHIPQKKARVFFTEDQREHLRKAYNQDPYPNQTRIEQLGRELGVTSKTIINWFHNHRMRSKPRINSPTSSSSSGPTPTGDYHVRAESVHEELSNQSTAASSDAGQETNAGGSVRPGMSQWMFPQFEPVSLRRDSLNSSDRESLVSGKSSPGISNVKNCPDVNDEVTQQNAEGEDRSKGGSGETVPETKSSTGESDGGNQLKEKASVSRRKSACPQRAYEGVHLDRCLNADSPLELPSTEPSTPCSSLSADPSEPVRQEAAQSADAPQPIREENANDQLSTPKEDSQSTPRSCNTPEPIREKDSGSKVASPEAERRGKIEKLQQKVISPDMDWEETDREGNIEKIQKNLSQQEPETWAF